METQDQEITQNPEQTNTEDAAQIRENSEVAAEEFGNQLADLINKYANLIGLPQIAKILNNLSTDCQIQFSVSVAQHFARMAMVTPPEPSRIIRP